MLQSETHNKPTYVPVWLQYGTVCELLVVVYWILVDIIILGGEIVEEHLH